MRDDGLAGRAAVTHSRSAALLRLARVVTEVLAPAPVVAVLLLIIAWHAAPTPAGLAWGLVTALVASALPFLYVLRGVRRQRLTDRHVGRREQRARPLAVAIASLAVLLALLLVGGAPRELIAAVAAIAAALVAGTLVTLAWKISGHAGVVAGAVVMLVIAFGPALLALAPLVALVGWARVAIRDHTPAQVVAGAALGALVSGAVFLLARAALG
ncbi:MAG TPA: phosphatase PAP2 family protein [Thermomicrobiales bacterium]|nr:phosphatase PAP2 family protein [Thermomicrobiales bacterium]